MIEKKTIVDQIEIARDGSIQIRLGLLLVEDGSIIDCKWHRTRIAQEGNVSDQMASVNEQLAKMGKELVSEADIARIQRHFDVEYSDGSTQT